MKALKYLFSILVVCAFISCDNKDDDSYTIEPTVVEEQIDLVTGLILKDNAGVLIDTVGNPNINTQDLLVFPNPARSVVFVQVENSAKFWIVPGIKEDSLFTDVDFPTVFLSETYTESELDSLSIIRFNLNDYPNLNQYSIDLTDFPESYYRLFIQRTDGSIAWDNFYIYHTNEDQIDAALKLIIEWAD